MYTLKIPSTLVVSHEFIDYSLLLPHEQIVKDRAETFLNYLKSIEGYVVIPAILACSKTNLIIDGHHRYWALKQLGMKNFPVTYLDYDSEFIVPHINSSITKKEIMQAANSGELLTPKSSYHHFYNTDDQKHYPIILLSSLFKVDF